MTGGDTGDGLELDWMTSSYIWVTAKAHEVMDDYLKYQFFEHPAIVAVLARYLTASAILPLQFDLQSLHSPGGLQSFQSPIISITGNSTLIYETSNATEMTQSGTLRHQGKKASRADDATIPYDLWDGRL